MKSAICKKTAWDPSVAVRNSHLSHRGQRTVAYHGLVVPRGDARVELCEEILLELGDGLHDTKDLRRRSHQVSSWATGRREGAMVLKTRSKKVE